MPKKQQRSINEINRQTTNRFLNIPTIEEPQIPETPPPPPQPKKQRPKRVQKPQPEFMPYGQDAAAYAPNAQVYHQAAKTGMSTKKKVLLIIVLALLAVMLAAGTAFALYINGIGNTLNKGNKSDAELLAIEDALGGHTSNFDEPFYMLLLGTDGRNGEEKARTDTNIVVRVDPIKDQLTLLSIPRDTKIEIDGYGTQKFNAAYSLGKVPGVIEATENLLDIKISHYAEVSFLELKGLVDAVGGVTVDVESRIDDYHCDDGDGNHYVIEPGTQRLGGGAALTFARTRQYATGDFVRTSHQRQLVESIVREVIHAPITKIPSIIQAAAECVTTDISIKDIISLAQQFADNDDIVVYNAMLPSYTQNINGISFVINDRDMTKKMMKFFKSGKDPSEIVSNMTAEDIISSAIDTSNVIILDEEEAAAAAEIAKENNLNGDNGNAQNGENGNGAGAGNQGDANLGGGGNAAENPGAAGGNEGGANTPNYPGPGEGAGGGGNAADDGSIDAGAGMDAGMDV